MRTCIDCGKEVKNLKAIRCKKCFKKFNKKENHINWKGGKPKCKDCNKQLTNYKTIRCRKCYYKFQKGSNHPSFKEGRKKTSAGYIYINSPYHPFRNCDNHVAEHRLIMENFLKKTTPRSIFLIRIKKELYLNPKYLVHHKNGIKDDNRIKNLKVLTKKEHQQEHKKSTNSLPN